MYVSEPVAFWKNLIPNDSKFWYILKNLLRRSCEITHTNNCSYAFSSLSDRHTALLLRAHSPRHPSTGNSKRPNWEAKKQMNEQSENGHKCDSVGWLVSLSHFSNASARDLINYHTGLRLSVFRFHSLWPHPTQWEHSVLQVFLGVNDIITPGICHSLLLQPDGKCTWLNLEAQGQSVPLSFWPFCVGN